MNEGKKDRRDPIRTVKPRNFVAKNASATTSGAGAHKDKKKAAKQGDVKHKKAEYAESLQHMLESALRDKEDLQAKRKTLQDLSMNKDVDQKAVTQRKLDLEKEAKKKGISEEFDSPEYNDEAGMAEGNLLTLARAVKGLYDTIEEDDNLPEWCQEKIAKAEMMLVSVWDYLLSQKERGIDPSVKEATRTFAPPKTDLKVGDRVVADLRKEKNYPTDQKYVSGFVTRVGEKGVHIDPDGGGEAEWHPYKIVKKLGEGWTHDSLAAQLFETENTYEDKLANLLNKRLGK